MKHNSFEYFLNAVHYFLWIFDIRFSNYCDKIFGKLVSPIGKFLFTEEQKRKYYERKAEHQKELDTLLFDKEYGIHIGWANHWFGYFYSCYPSLLSFVLLGIVDKISGGLSMILATLLFLIPTGLCYIPAYKSVFAQDRYLKYFKQFEKEDERWHRKWKWRTIVFCIGGVISFLMGIFAMWGVGKVLN